MMSLLHVQEYPGVLFKVVIRAGNRSKPQVDTSECSSVWWWWTMLCMCVWVFIVSTASQCYEVSLMYNVMTSALQEMIIKNSTM